MLLVLPIMLPCDHPNNATILMVSHGSTYRLHLVVHIILKPKRNVLFCLLLKDTRYQRIAEKLKTWCWEVKNSAKACWTSIRHNYSSPAAGVSRSQDLKPQIGSPLLQGYQPTHVLVYLEWLWFMIIILSRGSREIKRTMVTQETQGFLDRFKPPTW
jgi:hypothetical protein